MFNENLKSMRKRRGFSQEQLSMRLNVVRQTISKWEKGLSLPDAEMLLKISEVLDVTVSDLLGKNIVMEQNDNFIDTIAHELQKLNELLAIQQNRRASLIKKIAVGAGILFLFCFLVAIYDRWNEMFYELGQNIYNWLH